MQSLSPSGLYIPLATSCVVVILLFYLSALFFFPTDRQWDPTNIVNLKMLVLAVFSTICVQYSFFIVGSHFFHEGLVSSIIPNLLTIILSVFMIQTTQISDPRS